MALISIKSFEYAAAIALSLSEGFMKRFNPVSAGRYKPIIHAATVPNTVRREPTVFDSVMWQALLTCNKSNFLAKNDRKPRSPYFTKSFTSDVSILIPGPIVVDTAIPFR